MRTILFLYLTTALHFATTSGSKISNGFKMACYFLPLLGGYIADRWLGRYWTIVGFSVPYVLGHFILGIPNDIAMFIALALLAGGSGVIKPNISTLMGHTYDQKRPGQEALRSAAFLWFYFSINIGALISTFTLPMVRDTYMYDHLTAEARAEVDALKKEGKEVDVSTFATDQVKQAAYGYAFQFPAWLMVASLIVFAAGKRTYALDMPERHELTPEERSLQWQTLGRLFGIFALCVLFWVGYEHNDNIWVSFIQDYVNLRVPFTDWSVPPDQLQSLNALFVVLSIPTFNFLFRRFDPHVKVFTPMRKILAGFLLTAASIAIMAVAGFMTQGQTGVVLQQGKMVEVSTVKVSVVWPAMAYIVLTLGEVLLYGTMLELAYTAAPKSMKGFVTAVFLTTSAFGNLINVGWAPMYGGSLTDEVSKRGPLLPGPFFSITTGIVVAAAIGFLFIGRRFERAQSEQEAIEAAKKALAVSDVSAAPRAPSGDGVTDRDRIQ
jgi:POT family proton-dependent oligopeptide transporter